MSRLTIGAACPANGDGTYFWEQEQEDLTPFVEADHPGCSSNTSASALGETLLYGWLLDDVGLTGLSGGAGYASLVSMNLGQGSFSLSGPART